MHKMGSDDCVAEQEAQRRRPYRKGSTDTKIKPGSNFKRQSPVTSQTSSSQDSEQQSKLLLFLTLQKFNFKPFKRRFFNHKLTRIFQPK